MLEVDGRAPTSAHVDYDRFRCLAPQGFDVEEIHGEQCLKHRSLSLGQRSGVHTSDHLIKMMAPVLRHRREERIPAVRWRVRFENGHGGTNSLSPEQRP